jgi:vacuolar-type H+-ATPase subunit H
MKTKKINIYNNGRNTMSNNIKEAEEKLKKAFGEEAFNNFKKEQNKIIEKNRKEQMEIRNNMFRKMEDTTSMCRF